MMQQNSAATATITTAAIRFWTGADILTGGRALRLTSPGANVTWNRVSFSGACSIAISFALFGGDFGNDTSFVGVNPDGSRNRYVAFFTGIRKFPTHAASNTFSPAPDSAP